MPGTDYCSQAGAGQPTHSLFFLPLPLFYLPSTLKRRLYYPLDTLVENNWPVFPMLNESTILCFGKIIYRIACTYLWRGPKSPTQSFRIYFPQRTDKHHREWDLHPSDAICSHPLLRDHFKDKNTFRQKLLSTTQFWFSFCCLCETLKNVRKWGQGSRLQPCNSHYIRRDCDCCSASSLITVWDTRKFKHFFNVSCNQNKGHKTIWFLETIKRKYKITKVTLFLTLNSILINIAWKQPLYFNALAMIILRCKPSFAKG